MFRVRHFERENVFHDIFHCDKKSLVELAVPVPRGGGLQPVHPLLRGRLPLDQLPHLRFKFWQIRIYKTSLRFFGLHTFSCSIFKCLLISETSPSLEEEENSEKVYDSDAAVDFDSGLLLRDFELIGKE